MFGDNNLQVLQALVGNVEWVVCHPNLQNGLDVAFRVDGELRGFSIGLDQRYRVYDAPQPHNTPRDVAIEPLSHERVLTLVSYCERYRKTDDLLTEVEAAELNIIAEKSKRQSEAVAAKREQEDIERRRRQYENLKQEFEGKG